MPNSAAALMYQGRFFRVTSDENGVVVEPATSMHDESCRALLGKEPTPEDIAGAVIALDADIAEEPAVDVVPLARAAQALLDEQESAAAG